jgi:hypothetical protein
MLDRLVYTPRRQALLLHMVFGPACEDHDEPHHDSTAESVWKGYQYVIEELYTHADNYRCVDQAVISLKEVGTRKIYQMIEFKSGFN